MTSSIAAVVSTAPPANSPVNDSTSSSANDPNNNFSKPLQQAHHQLAQQSDTSQPTHARHAHAKSHASSPSGQKGKSGRNDDTSASATPDAATAMLALLGQSVPASAAASAVPAAADGDDATDAVTANTSGVAAANIALLGAAQATGQATAPAKAGSADDFTKAMDGIQDKSLSMAAQGSDDGDESVDAAAADTAQNATSDAFTNALQALTGASSNPGQKTDPMDALKNLTAQAMSQQPQTPSSVATTPAPHVLTMQSSVDSPSFGQELSQQVTWLGGQDVKEARIRLHPEDLGELDVKVSVKQDHVDVAFIAQHPQAVHAVQQTLSQLDSMLAHHGLSLGQAQVGQGNTGQGSSAQAGNSGGSSSGGESGLADGVGELASLVSPVGKVVGLVDMFA
jgi:flagellar hook-length control protein FliK